jgi:hypothetical protein
MLNQKIATACFLFQRRPDRGWSGGKKALYWVWNLGMLLLAAVGITLVSLMLAVGSYALRLCLGYFERPLIFALNLLPCAALLFLLYGLTGRAGCSFLITCVPVLGLAVGNYYKLAFRDDPVMFADLLVLKEAGTMAGQYQLFFDKKLALTLVCVVLGWAILHVFVRVRPSGRGRVGCALICAAAWVGILPLCRSDTVYNTHAAHYTHLDNVWSATQQYIAHGCLYPFLHSLNDAFETPPEGYDKSATAQLLAQYEDADIPEDQKVNIVGIMLEAYNDFTKFGVPELAQDVYQVWHQLEEEGYSGNLVTNIFAGGTVDTERCFLTGDSTLGNFRGRTNSYVWYFRSQGYLVEGMHPCYQWFYNRSNINENLGFEDYKFVETYFGQFTDGNVALDDVFFPELLRAYQEGTAGDEPYFSFSVTYQGHGPYDSDVCWWGEKGDFVVDDGTYTQEEQYILDNYFGSIANTNQHLKELTDYFRQDDEPVILILFGDHNPWMGDGNSVYTALGVNFDMSTQEGFLNYYSTRYIIWANDAAKEILGCDFQGEGPDLGPYFLMSQLFQLCGWEGPAYMQAIADVPEQVSVIHTTGRYLENGVLTDSLSEQGALLVNRYQALQYYWRNTFAY